MLAFARHENAPAGLHEKRGKAAYVAADNAALSDRSIFKPMQNASNMMPTE